jgi:hypothetical protein
MHSKQHFLTANASRIQEEALRAYGRELSQERALEIAEEIRRYEEAIQRVAQSQGLNDEPASFVETLVRLRIVEIE